MDDNNKRNLMGINAKKIADNHFTFENRYKLLMNQFSKDE